MTEDSHLVLEQHDSVTVIGFRGPTVLDAYHIGAISEELYALVERQGYRRLVVDLGAIKILSSQTLGTLLNLRQKLEAVEGKMVISGVDPRLYRVFKITNLQSVFEFYDDVESAVKALQSG